jgi:hypothetical protein
MIVAPFVLSLVLAADAEPAPKLPLGKDTTYVTGPLDKDGYIDYEAALNDRLGKGITPETNANVLIWKAVGPTPEGGKGMPAEYFKRLGMDEPPKDGDYFVSFGAYVKDRLKLEPDQTNAKLEEQAAAVRGPWVAKDHPDIAAWLEVNEKPLAGFVEATRRPEYFNPLVSRDEDGKRGSLMGALLPAIQKCRDAASALSARAMLRIQEGKYDDAWQDLLACHRLGRLVGRGSTLIEALVGFAIDAVASKADLQYLARADLSADQLRDRLKDLQALPPLPPLADKLDLGERFGYLDAVQQVRRGGMDALNAIADSQAPKQPAAGQQNSLAEIDWTPVLRGGNVWHDRMAAALRVKDRAERERELGKIHDDLKALKAVTNPPWIAARVVLGNGSADTKAGKVVGDILITLLMPAVQKVQQAHDRDEQLQNNEQVAFALAAYRRDEGKYPGKLGDLAPKYLTPVPDDLFSGGPLIYHPSDKGYLFYSVGVNGKDEGGRTTDDDPRGDDLPVVMPPPPLKPKQ